jgi:predicted nucleotidyltransferase
VTVESVQIHMDPFNTGTSPRDDDIMIIGSASSGLSNEDIDIIVVSLASQTSQTAPYRWEP